MQSKESKQPQGADTSMTDSCEINNELPIAKTVGFIFLFDCLEAGYKNQSVMAVSQDGHLFKIIYESNICQTV